MKSNFLVYLIITSIICGIVFVSVFVCFAIFLRYNAVTDTGFSSFSLNKTNFVLRPLLKLSSLAPSTTPAAAYIKSETNKFNECGKPTYEPSLKVSRIISGSQAAPHRYLFI